MITFIEHYLSNQKAGHFFKNVFYFSSIFDMKGINYEFILEKKVKFIVKNHYHNFKYYFKDREYYKRLPLIDKVALRKREYRDLFLNRKSKIFFIFTMNNEDFLALVRLLEDKEIVNRIIENNVLIIAHSGGIIYPALYVEKDKINQIIKKLKRHIVFSFYSELQAIYIKKFFGLSNFIFLHIPNFLKINTNKEKKYISLLGDFRFDKFNGYLLKIIEKYDGETFLIQFNNINKSNFLLWKTLYNFKNLKVILNFLDNNSFMNYLEKSKLGIMTYDPYRFALQSSGILEEYGLARTPVIVPENTWLHYFMKKFSLLGESYDPFSIDDFLFKFDRLTKREISCNRINEDLHNLNSVDKFISDIMNLYNTREFETEIRVESHLKGIVNEALKKGEVEYLTNVAELLIHNKREREAYNILKNVIKKDERYIRAYYLLLKYFNYSKKIYYFDNYKSTNTYDPVTLNRITEELIKRDSKIKNVNCEEMIEPAFLEISELVDLAIEIKQKGCVSKKIEQVLNRLGMRIRESTIEVNNDELSRNIEEISSLIDKNNLFLIYYYLGDKIYNKGLKGYKYFFYKALEMILYKRKKKDIDIYHLASIYGKIGEYRKAKERFREVIKNTNNGGLKAGAYFHLGEIALQEGENKKAEKYFKKCLELKSVHRKSREYLKKLSKDFEK